MQDERCIGYERGKKAFEELIRTAKPEFVLSWSRENKESETFTVFITRPREEKRIRLRIHTDALEQAGEDPSSILRLHVEVERALRVAESCGIGYVGEI